MHSLASIVFTLHKFLDSYESMVNILYFFHTDHTMLPSSCKEHVGNRLFRNCNKNGRDMMFHSITDPDVTTTPNGEPNERGSVQ